MLSVKKLHDDLDYWMMIGIGDDIFKAPQHRPEYQHIVQKINYAFPNLDQDTKLEMVLIELKNELKSPWFLRPTFWRLLWLWIKGKITRK